MNAGDFIRRSTICCCLVFAALSQDVTGALAQNAVREANAGPDQIVSSGEPVSLDGSDSMFPDSEIISWQWERTGGTGNSNIVIYDTDTDSPYFTAEDLRAGSESVTHEFTLVITGTDDETATDDVEITVESEFLRPVARPGEDLRVTSGTRVSLDGSDSEVDHSRTIAKWEWTFIGDSLDSPPNLVGENTSILSFVAENPEPGAKDLWLLFALTITDNAGNVSAPVQITVVVTSPLIIPVANAGPDQIVSSGKSVSLDGGSSTFDGGEIILWDWQRTGGTGDPNIVISDADTDSPYFTAEILQPGKKPVTHEFTLTVTGANNVTATDDVVITVESAFLLPVADPGEDLTVISGTRVSLDGSGSRVDHSRTITNWEWARIGGSPESSPRLEGMDTSTLSFIAENPEPGADEIRHLFTLVITDDAGNVSSPEEITIIVTAPPILPVANAGPDRTVPSNEFVYLDGSGSTFDGGDIISWQWEHTGGTGKSDIVIHNADTDSPYFITDRLSKGKAPITYEITLTVTGANNEIATDEIVITVESLFLLPVADPGDNLKVDSGTMVHLDGGDSRVDHSRTIVKWNWTYIGGSPDFSPVFVGTDTSILSFLAENPEPAARDVRHLFTLTITDDAGNVSLPGPITVIVESPVIAPVAIAGEDKTVSTKWPVFLDGRRTTGDPRAKLFYRWKRTGGTPRFPTSELNLAGVNEDVAYFYFNPLKPGNESETHEITLTVTDNLGSPASVDVITITVISVFVKPVADAGDDLVVATGTQVMLDGGDSIVDRRSTLEYSWTRTGGTQGVDAVLAGAQTANPVFTAGTVIPGMEEIEHIFTLTVTDSENQISSDTVKVTIVTAFAQPFADAGSDQKVNSGQTVLLEGTGTVDRYRMPASLLWTRTGGTEGVNVVLDDATSSTPSFTALNSTPGARDVIHEFTLTVRDSVGKTASDMVMVTVISPIARPFANAGEDRSIMAGETVLLDGRGSGTDYRKTLAYAWKRTGGTGNPSLSLMNENTAEPSFVADSLAPGVDSVTHIFSLDVTDGGSIIPISDEVTITVLSANAQPIADAGDDLIVSPDTYVALDGRRSLDMDGQIVSWKWTRVDGSGETGVALKDSDTSGPSFIAEKPEPGTGDVFHVFSLVVTDNRGAVSQQDTVKVIITSRILPPIANAGPDLMVRSGTETMLDGSRSIFDPRNPITSWNWRRIGGSSDFVVELQDADTASPVFTAEDLATGAEQTTHILELKVTDSKGETSFDTVTVTVNSPFESLEANAGPDRTVDPQVGVFLDAVASRGDRRAKLFYKWTHSAGPKEAIHALRETDSARMSFITGSIIPGSADVTHEFTLTVTDNLGSSPDSDTAMVTVVAPFASLVARAGGNWAVASGTRVILDGSASTVDRRKTLISYAWTRTGGSGDSGVKLANADTERASFTAETLTPGANDVTHEFTLMITDHDGLSATDRAVITVTAPFASPVADAGDDRTVESGTAVILDDGASTSDRRRSLAYTWQRTGGTERTGNVQITLERSDTQKPSFTADFLIPGTDDIIHEFTLTVTDSAGLSATDQVIITVTAPFARTIADAGGDRTVMSGEDVILDGSESTADRRRTFAHAWTRTGGSDVSVPVLKGTDTAMLSFTVNRLEPGAKNVTHEFTLTVTDSTGLSVTDQVVVTIIAPHTAPVANAGGNRTVISGEDVTLDGTGSTSDRRTNLTYIWTRTGGSGNAKIDLAGIDTAELSFTADTLLSGASDVTHEFVLTVVDTIGRSARDRVTVTVTSPFTSSFASLVADAGKDRKVASGAAVVLDGTGSTFDPRRTIAYAWTRTGGTGGTGNGEINLTDTGSANASFTAQTLVPGAEDETHIFTLTVTDSGGEIDSDTVTITVVSLFAPPVANAGNDRTVPAGEPVTLDGRESTSDSRSELDFLWTRSDGTDDVQVILADAETARPVFTANALSPGAEDVKHIFTLTVTDDMDQTDTDTVTITVMAPFALPVARAGNDRTVAAGTPVVLDGGDSTFDRRRSLAYAWERTGETDDGGIILVEADSARASFTAQSLIPGAEDATHEFTLTVTDSAGEIDSDTVTITVMASFALPVAKAGNDRTVAAGTPVVLDGSGSTFDRRRSLAYAWERTGETDDGGIILAEADSARASFTAQSLIPGAENAIHEFTLTVTDSAGEIDSDTVTITVMAPFASPVAKAGNDRTVAAGTPVVLDGGDSTFDRRRSLAYAWERTGEFGETDDGGIILAEADAARASFTAQSLIPGAEDAIHEFTLTVTDSAGEIDSDTVTITVMAPFASPVARAGNDRTVVAGTPVVLDGGGSTFDRRRNLVYAWERTGETGDGGIILAEADTARASFTAQTLIPGAENAIHEFTLTVTDSAGEIDSDTVTITVMAPFASPVARAGNDRTVAAGTPVVLDGGDSTFDRRRSLAYAWERTGESGETDDGGIILAEADSARASFTAQSLIPGAEDAIHEFTLTVTDSAGEIDSDTVTITVMAPFVSPVARAGNDRTVAAGTPVVLDGGDSTFDRRRSLAYAWERTGETGDGGIILAEADTARASFTAQTLIPGAEDATHEFTLTVTDSAGETASDTVVITVTSPFITPVANAGKNRTVAPGATITLDSSASYADRRRTIASRTWTRAGGSGEPVTLSSTTAVKPSFVAHDVAPGADDVTYVFSLVVRDSAGEISAPVSVTITTVSGFIPLLANAGPDLNAAPEEPVILDGNKSTGDPRNRLSYSWARSGGTPDLSVSLKNADSARAEFTAAAIIPGNADVMHEFTLTVSDDRNSPVSSDTMTVTVIAPFAAPVANAGDNRTIASGETITLDGTDSTVDRRRTLSHAWTHSGGSGSPAITIAGENTARLTLTAENLKPGAEDVTHEFTLTVTDSDGETASTIVVVTVISPFAAPVAITGGNRTIASGETITLDGTGSTVDRRRTLSHAWTRSGGSGNPAITIAGENTARLTLTAENLKPGADDATHEFTLTVTDSDGETAAAIVVVTVTSPFAAPIANAGGNQTIASGETITLDGTGSTVDRRRTLSHAWTRSGGSGSPAITIAGENTARLTLTAENLKPGADDATHEFTLTVTDSDGETASAIAMITVTSPFAAPVANAGDNRTIASGETITLDGTGSTVDRRRTLSHAWTRSGGNGNPAITIAGENTARLTLTAENLKPGADDVTHEFTLTVTDSDGETASTIVVVTVTSPFAAPVVNAGGNRTIASGETITLDGTGSTVDRRRTLSHAWTRSGGSGSPAITIAGENTARLTLTAENLKPGADDVTHEFTLTVTDSDGETASSIAVITVTSPFVAPVANAGGDQTVTSGEPVILDGSASTSDPRLDLKHSWERTGGSGPFIASLETDGNSRRGFMADRLEPGDPDVIHIFTLTVTDSAGKTHKSTIQITIVSDFMLPVANAGVDRQVESGARVMLDGGNSIFDRRRSVDTWNWQRTGGTGVPVTLTGANTQQPFFFAETLAGGIGDVTHVFTLTVTDSGGDIAIDEVTITVAANVFPVADAGPNRTVKSGTTVTLEGSGSDRDGTVEAYMWERDGGNGNTAIALDNPNIARPSFTTETLQPGAKDVTYVFSLTVRNSKGTISLSDQVTITATSPFLPLSANAGSDRSAMPHIPVVLDGSNSSFDPRTPIVSWNWTRIGGNGRNESLSAANTAQPIFTSLTAIPGNVNYIYRLTVTDINGATAFDDVTITLNTLPSLMMMPLTANAGADITVQTGNRVVLDGTNSIPGRSTITGWNWIRSGGTPGLSIDFTDAHTARPSFIADRLEDGASDVIHIITLQVTDSTGKTATDDVTVTVRAPQPANEPNRSPVADAGPDQTVQAQTRVSLDGSKSIDRDGTITSWQWHMTDGSEMPHSSRTDRAKMNYIAPAMQPGSADIIHDFTLSITDNNGATATDTVKITVKAPSLPQTAVVVSRSELLIQNGNSATYNVRLDRSPGRDIKTTITSDSDRLTVEPAHLDFNGNNWNQWQQVTLHSRSEPEQDQSRVEIHHRIAGQQTVAGPATVVHVTIRAIDPVLHSISDYLITRAGTILGAKPEPQVLVGPRRENEINLRIQDGQMNLEGGFAHNEIWGEFTGAYTQTDTGKLKSAIAALGMHRTYSENLLIGGMVHFDNTAYTFNETDRIKGLGWLAGPYFILGHSAYPLDLQGHVLYGASGNTIRFNDSDLGARTGKFNTRKLLAGIKASGEIPLSKTGIQLVPYTAYDRFRDRAAEFTGQSGINIPGQNIELDRLELGVDLFIPISMHKGRMTVSSGFGLVRKTTRASYMKTEKHGFGRGEAGLAYNIDDRLQFNLKGFHEGLGEPDYKSYGIALDAELKF